MPENYISRLNLDGTPKPIKDGTHYNGTLAEWNTFSDAQKDQYDSYEFSDDFTEAPAITEKDFIVMGKTLYFPYHPQSNS